MRHTGPPAPLGLPPQGLLLRVDCDHAWGVCAQGRRPGRTTLALAVQKGCGRAGTRGQDWPSELLMYESFSWPSTYHRPAFVGLGQVRNVG